VTIRTFNVLRELSRDFDLTALCFHRRSLGSDRSAKLAALREWADVQAFSVPQEESRLRLLWDHLRSLLGNRVYTRFVYESGAFDRALDELLASRSFDLVQLESLDMARCRDRIEGRPVTCVHHNVESDLLERYALRERGFRRAYLRHQSALMRREEQDLCPRMAFNVAMSDEDRRRFAEIAPGARFIVVPNGVDVDYFQPARRERQGIVFVGGTIWFPNRDAIEFYARDILPRIRAKASDAETTWVGRIADEDRKRFGALDGLRLTGYVPDVRPYVHGAACFVVPLRVGGGTRLKILDAWAMGAPVVSTSVGCEGLAAVDDQNIVIRDDPADFADAVCELLADPARQARLGNAGRETAVGEYSWEAIGRGIRREYRELLESPGSSIG